MRTNRDGIRRLFTPPTEDHDLDRERVMPSSTMAAYSFGVETVMDEGGNDGVETIPNNSTMGASSMRSCSFDKTAHSSLSSQEEGNKARGDRSKDDDDDSILDQHCITSKSCSFVNGSWICPPYKQEQLHQQIQNNSPGSGRRQAVIETLQELGVKVFIIDAASTDSTADIVLHIRRVVAYVARENCVEPRTGPLGFQRCLLYQDKSGRLFNLMLPSHTVGPAATYQGYLESFSGREAMIAATVLCRSLPCIAAQDVIGNLRPAYLTLILGFALNEELSLSWLNASMLVRATPSVSAHSLTSPVGSDSLRKLVLLALAFAVASTGTLQTVFTIAGIVGAILIFLANLGARSWHFLRWKPLRYNGCGSFLLAYVLAITTGILLPYMGHRTVAIGGKGAIEYVLKTSIIVAIVFVLSDFDEIQKFLVLGSDLCNQDPVNVMVGVWWSLTLLFSLCLVRKIKYTEQKPQSGEKLLEEDHASPVGYKVPSLPDFEIDPGMVETGIKCIPLQLEFMIGVVMAIGVGIAIVSLAYTTWDEEFYDEIAETVVD